MRLSIEWQVEVKGYYMNAKFLKKKIIETFSSYNVYFEYVNKKWDNWQEIPNDFIMRDEFLINKMSENELLLYLPRLMIFALDDLETKYLTDGSTVDRFIFMILKCKDFNCLTYSDSSKNKLVQDFLEYILKQDIYENTVDDYNSVKNQLINENSWRHPYK